MKIASNQPIKINNDNFEVEDSQRGIKLRIEAAHAGKVNGNFLFYTPSSLMKGADSLKEFYKPLQKKHWSKTLGYIYDSTYEELDTSSSYYSKIAREQNPEKLVRLVKDYIKSNQYKSSPGFGVLVAKANLFDKKKIKDLKEQDVGTVSVAGDSPAAYCSICSNLLTDCNHKLGTRYQGETCIGIIADNLNLDHISFETIPANWDTKTTVIQDSQLVGSLEIITEGKTMTLTLENLKEKLTSGQEEFLTELGLSNYLEQYATDVEGAISSSFLLAADRLLPTNTPLTIYVAQKLIDTLEESEDKQILASAVEPLFKELFEGKTEEEVATILVAEVSEKTIEPENEPVKAGEAVPEPIEPVKEQPTIAIADSDKIALAIADSLALTLDNKLVEIVEKIKEVFTQENTAKANRILEDRLKAFESDLSASDVLNSKITEELKESILNQIVLLKKVDRDSDYFKALQSRSVEQLKMTLQDHLFTSAEDKTPEPLKVQDNLQQPVALNPVALDSATNAMTEDTDPAPLVIEDADQIVTQLISDLPEGKMSKNAFYKLYKSVYAEHGSKVAKKLQPVLVEQNKL